MKIRLGFVTNSSSSSFIVAVKEKDNQFTEELDALILKWVKEKIFGESRIRNMKELEEFAEENCLDHDDEMYIKAKEMINAGYSVIENSVGFGNAECEMMDVYEELFRKLERSTNDFQGIDTDMEC